MRLSVCVSTYLYTSIWRHCVCARAYMWLCANNVVPHEPLLVADIFTFIHSSNTWTSPSLQKQNKNVILGRCYHMFCRSCIDQNMAKRNRKCPECAVHFGQDDLHKIWLFDSNDS